MDVTKINEKISFTWNIHFKCNYRCPYCWFDGKWQELAKLNRYLPVKELIRPWENIYKRYGSVQINIVGGEPFLYPNFVDLIKELSNLHTIGITTNLSINIETFIKQVSPSNVGLLPTFHPLFAKFDDFIKKVLLLQENKFTNKVAYLAYPPQIKQIDYYRKGFENEGFTMEVMTFWGEYNGVSYPAGYTEEEREMIKPCLGERSGEKFQLTPKKMEKGKLCHAGHRYAVINADGEVARCGGFSSELIGNFFDENFKLLDQPLSCNSEYCPCNEWAFLLVEGKEETLDFLPVQKEILDEEKKEVKILPRALISPYQVFFSWYINNECNYKCSYCLPENIKTINIKMERWFEIWDKIFDRYGCCHIDISGGEPFLYPSFIELIKYLSQKHTLQFSTNLSWDIKPFIENIKPRRARIGASLHPEFVNFKEFLEKLKALKEKGFNIWVNYVGYPPILKFMSEYKRDVEEQRISFSILPFSGEYNGRAYPQGYTEEEKQLLMIFDDAVNKNTIEWRTEKGRNNTKGELCRMGQMYARIYPDGEVHRCCNKDVLRLGNLVDGTFSLLEEPMPCESDNCLCWKCMLVDKEDYWQNYWRAPSALID